MVLRAGNDKEERIRPHAERVLGTRLAKITRSWSCKDNRQPWPYGVVLSLPGIEHGARACGLGGDMCGEKGKLDVPQLN